MGRGGKTAIPPSDEASIYFELWRKEMGKKDVFGIVVNLNHTDTYNNGYYCVYKHQVSFVLETSIKSMQLSNGIHYHQ